jgi:hypothetical protein
MLQACTIGSYWKLTRYEYESRPRKRLDVGSI